MNTVNLVMAIGIVVVGFLIRREVKHGQLLDEMLREDGVKAARENYPNQSQVIKSRSEPVGLVVFTQSPR